MLEIAPPPPHFLADCLSRLSLSAALKPGVAKFAKVLKPYGAFASPYNILYNALIIYQPKGGQEQ